MQHGDLDGILEQEKHIKYKLRRFEYYMDSD